MEILKKNTMNRGKFKLKILRLNLCKGPKRLDCCKISANVVNSTHLDYTIEIVKTNIPNRGKVSITMNKQPLLRLQMKKPCDHLYMKGLFQTILNATQRCEFQKGKYHIDIDIDDVAKAYYGGEFLYGNMTFKSVFYNDECNFSCTEIDANFTPAPVNEKKKH
ncbi:uncharacterized protein LOC121736768 [Aricia agestis]|uniref:uncharacterized protein LOC121736768 n=1 Tax=Aricia agestis TaxID=91739 RepID=UPI001C20340B|nr:uncharacterized protein LOC121736768 [Aricia agestis]